MMADSSNMICPSCQTFQPKAEICSSCGVIISKVQDAESNKVQKPTEKQASKAPAMKIPVIVLVGAVVIGFLIFSVLGNDKEAGKASDNTSSSANENASTKKVDPLNRIAAFKPAVAEKIRISNVRSKLHALRPILSMYGMGIGEPPSNEQGLQFLVDQGDLTLDDITDEWGNVFVYQLEWGEERSWSKEYQIFVYSKGPDGISGNDDDIGIQ